MTQALNYTPKAIEALRSYPCPGAPISRAAMRYIADKLEQAEVFILPNLGQLLDRGKVRPEVPGLVFKPPYPVVALEYTADGATRNDDVYTVEPCSRRISLAWEWTNDLPPPFGRIPELRELSPGVAIASVYYSDRMRTWMCTPGALQVEYDAEWRDPLECPLPPFHKAMIERGALSQRLAATAKGIETSFIPLFVEHLVGMERGLGSKDAVIDFVRADVNDECNAYADLCYALACRNVSTERNLAPAALNKQRIRSGKLPLKDFHILKLSGATAEAGFAHEGGDRAGPRPHLRRGHIRRLSDSRITWVNQTMVRGRGEFLDKVYAV